MKISAEEPEGKDPATDEPTDIDNTLVTEASTEALPSKTGMTQRTR